MGRIKITGYIEDHNLSEDQFDEDSEDGLTEEAYANVIGNEDGNGYKIGDLTDLEVEWED